MNGTAAAQAVVEKRQLIALLSHYFGWFVYYVRRQQQVSTRSPLQHSSNALFIIIYLTLYMLYQWRLGRWLVWFVGGACSVIRHRFFVSFGILARLRIALITLTMYIYKHTR